jgi:hypothetical protein
MNATLEIDGEKLTYREDGVVRVYVSGDKSETCVSLNPRFDYRIAVIRELLKRIASAKYACEYALQDLVDEGNDDGEIAENLRQAISDITCKHMT